MSKKRKLVYLSHILGQDTPAYGGGEGPEIFAVKDMSKGDSCNTQEWKLSNHVGTHIDAPRHFHADGATIDSYPPEFWECRKISVVDLPLEEGRLILPEDIEGGCDKESDCLLIKTSFQKYRGEKKYSSENPGLSPELGKWLRENLPNLKFVGMDFISISSYLNREKGREAHKVFLNPAPPGSPILPIEDMDLSEISSGAKLRSVRIFPLLVKGADGAPATILAEIDS